jgi:hypothetical protein
LQTGGVALAFGAAVLVALAMGAAALAAGGAELLAAGVVADAALTVLVVLVAGSFVVFVQPAADRIARIIIVEAG